MAIKDMAEKARTAMLNHASHKLDKLQDVLDLIERLREMLEKAFGINSKYSAITSQLRALHDSIEDGIATGEITNDKLDYIADTIKKLYASADKLTPDSVDTVIDELNTCEAKLREDLTKNVIMSSPALSENLSKEFISKWIETINNYYIANNKTEMNPIDKLKLRREISTEDELLELFEKDAKLFKDEEGNYFFELGDIVVKANLEIDDNRKINVTFKVPDNNEYYEDVEVKGLILPTRKSSLEEVKPTANAPVDMIQLYIYNACKDKGYDYYVDVDTAKQIIENKVNTIMQTSLDKAKTYGEENYEAHTLLIHASSDEGYTSKDGKISAKIDPQNHGFKLRDNDTGVMITFVVKEGELKIDKCSSSNEDFTTNNKYTNIGEWKRDPEDEKALLAKYNYPNLDVTTLNLLKSEEAITYMGMLGISAENQVEALTREFDKKEHWSKVDKSHIKDIKKFQSKVDETISTLKKQDKSYNGYHTQLKTFSSDDGKKEYTFLNIYAKNGDRMSFAFDMAGNPVALNYYNKENDKKYHSFYDLKTLCLAQEASELISDKDFCNMYNICRQVLGKDQMAKFDYKPIEKLDEKEAKPDLENKFGLAKTAVPVNEMCIFDDKRPSAYVYPEDRKFRGELSDTAKFLSDNLNNIALYVINLPANMTEAQILKKVYEECDFGGVDTKEVEHFKKTIAGTLHDLGVLPNEANAQEGVIPKRMTEKEYVQVIAELAANPEMREKFDKYIFSPVSNFSEAMEIASKEQENFTATLIDSYAVHPDRHYSVYTNHALADYTRSREMEGVIAALVEKCLESNEVINSTTIQQNLKVDYSTALKIMNTMVQCGIATEENNNMQILISNKEDVIKQIGYNSEKEGFQQTIEIAKEYSENLENHLMENDEVTIANIKSVSHVSYITAGVIADNLVKDNILNAPQNGSNVYTVNKDNLIAEHNRIAELNDNDKNSISNKKPAKNNQPVERD